MSCLIAERETVSKVSNFISRLLNQGFNSFGFSPNETVLAGFGDCVVGGFYSANQIYNKLYTLNFKAYNGRYEDRESFEDVKQFYANPDVDIWERRKVENHNELAQPWHYEILKHIQFIAYQLNEDKTYNHETTKALQELITILSRFISTHNEIYASFKWC